MCVYACLLSSEFIFIVFVLPVVVTEKSETTLINKGLSSSSGVYWKGVACGDRGS